MALPVITERNGAMSQKILIVDDEPDVIIFLSAVLEENGYTAIGAKDGIEALEIVHKENPDLVLLDLMLPRKSGITMFQELRRDRNTSGIPVVMVTGVSEMMGVDFKRFPYQQPTGSGETISEASEPAEAPVPDGYIEKPVDPEELIKVIRQALKE